MGALIILCQTVVETDQLAQLIDTITNVAMVLDTLLARMERSSTLPRKQYRKIYSKVVCSNLKRLL